MKKTAKTSIAAIIFVTIYFSFIIFLSLFKGINLYNISLGNIKTNHLFIKIDKKFIIKAQNIKIIITKKHVTKQTLKLHKIIYLSSKFLPLIKEIDLENIYQNKTLLFKKIKLKNSTIEINSKNLKSQGKIFISKHYTHLKLKYLKITKYYLKNIDAIIYITKNYTFLNIKGEYNHPIYLSLKIDKSDKILSSLYIPKEYIKIKQYNIKINHLFSLSKIYLNTLTFFTKGKFKKLIIKNKKFSLNLENGNFSFKNKYFTLKSKKAFLKKNTYKINLSKINLITNIKKQNIILNAKKINIKKSKYDIKAYNFTLNTNKDLNPLFIHTINLKINNDINYSAKELTIYKDKKLYMLIQDNKIKHTYFKFYNKQIKANQNIAKLTDLIGKILKFPTKIKSPLINLKNKTAKSSLISINEINFTNNILSFKNNISFHTTTKTLINKNLKEILNFFKINIPFTQLKGENFTNLNIYYENNQTLKVNYSVNSKNSILNYKDFNISFSNLNASGDLNHTDLNISNLFIPNEYLYTILSNHTYLNLNKKYINSDINVKILKVKNFLNIKNFKEKLVIDFLNKFMYLLNSEIFINLTNNTIFLYNLKKLINYSPFKILIDSGEAIIKIINNYIKINLNTNLKYPIILNNKNPKNLKANIDINNSNIIITNPKFTVKIINFKEIKAYDKDLNLSVAGILNIINDTQKIIKELNLTQESNSSLVTTIKSKNTNFIYKNHIFLTQNAYLKIAKEIEFNAQYKNSSLKGYTKKGFLLIEGKNYNKETLLPLLSFFKNFSSINLDFILVRSPKDFYLGKIYINKGIIKELKSLNNLVAFINTIPAILSLNSPGFSAKGYKIKKGFISYLFYNNILYFKKIDITGENLDFKGKGYIDLKKNKIKLKIDTILKIKLKKIPIIGKGISYILFGKDGYLHVKVIIKGNLNNPTIEKDILGNPIETPFKLFKRIITLPFHLF